MYDIVQKSNSLPRRGLYSEYLYLQGNGFSGTIPSNLGDCSSLLALDVSHNQLNGTVPVEFGLFQFIGESAHPSVVFPSGFALHHLTAVFF
jgi:hypothetical protein